MTVSKYINILNEYQTCCEYIKQINSNKAYRYYKYNNFITISTIIITIVLSAIAFADKASLINILQLDSNNTTEYVIPKVEFVLNILVLITLILTVLNLIFRFHEKSMEYFNSVRLLSSFIKKIERFKLTFVEKDELIDDEHKEREFILEFNNIESEYEIIMNSIPMHTDNEFLKAKYNIKIKNEISSQIKNQKGWSIYIWVRKIYLGIFLTEK